MRHTGQAVDYFDHSEEYEPQLHADFSNYSCLAQFSYFTVYSSI